MVYSLCRPVTILLRYRPIGRENSDSEVFVRLCGPQFTDFGIEELENLLN